MSTHKGLYSVDTLMTLQNSDTGNCTLLCKALKQYQKVSGESALATIENVKLLFHLDDVFMMKDKSGNDVFYGAIRENYGSNHLYHVAKRKGKLRLMKNGIEYMILNDALPTLAVCALSCNYFYMNKQKINYYTKSAYFLDTHNLKLKVAGYTLFENINVPANEERVVTQSDIMFSVGSQPAEGSNVSIVLSATNRNKNAEGVYEDEGTTTQTVSSVVLPAITKVNAFQNSDKTATFGTGKAVTMWIYSSDLEFANQQANTLTTQGQEILLNNVSGSNPKGGEVVSDLERWYSPTANRWYSIDKTFGIFLENVSGKTIITKVFRPYVAGSNPISIQVQVSVQTYGNLQGWDGQGNIYKVGVRAKFTDVDNPTNVPTSAEMLNNVVLGFFKDSTQPIEQIVTWKEGNIISSISVPNTKTNGKYDYSETQYRYAKPDDYNNIPLGVRATGGTSSANRTTYGDETNL